MKIDINQDKLPKKIILSRKGTDSSWGGSPGLRVGIELISLPIPEHNKKERRESCVAEPAHLTYKDLPAHPLVGNFIDYLLPSLKPEDCVHLDPDIRPKLRQNSTTPKFLFGQSAQAQSHLENQGIKVDDLFLFFGWFRGHQEEREKFKAEGPHQHILWGWFQVGEKHSVTTEQEADALSWARHHPHVSHWKRYYGNEKMNNTLYVATKQLSFLPSLKGAGVFNWSNSRCLTSHDPKCCISQPTRTEWCVPEFLATTGLTYNNPAQNERCPGSSKRIHIKSASIGQEFVFPNGKDKRLQSFDSQLRRDVADWLGEIFDGVKA